MIKRVLACLDVRDGRVVKGTQFNDIVDAGDPVECALRYAQAGADEIVMLDISATTEKRLASRLIAKNIAASIDIPLTVGGGVRTLHDIDELLESGADKVSINTAALANPSIIDEAAARFGSQCVVLAIDARLGSDGYTVATHGGSVDVARDALSWAREAQARGAGEILATSIDRDGTGDGFDLDLTARLSQEAMVPVIASGGARAARSFVDVFAAGTDAALGASAFHFGRMTIGDVKDACLQAGIAVRP